MIHSARILFLVKDLLDELRTEKIEQGTGAHLRVQELLRHLPDDLSEEDLLLALTPLMARSPQEQALLYEKFRDCQRRADDIFGERPPPPPPPPGPEDQKIKQWKNWVWASAAALALVLGGLVWMYFKTENKRLIEKSFAVTAGQTTWICPDAIPELDSFGQKLTNLSIEVSAQRNFTQLKRDWRQTGRTEPENTPVYAPSLGEASIQNDTCLTYTARDSALGIDSLVLQALFPNGNTCELRLRLFVSPPQAVAPSPAVSTPEFPIFQPRPLLFGHTQALLDLVISPADPWQSWLARHWHWLRWLLLLPFSLFVFALWQWIEWRRRKLVAELDRSDKPPYVWNIDIEGDDDDIVTGDDFHHALQTMRRRAATDTLRLDIARTIRATAERGGMAQFRFRPQTQPVDYLLLLDRQNAHNHRAQLFDAVFRAFQSQELYIERFFYDSDLRVCYNEAHPEGLRLADISQRYAQARLIVVGTGQQALSPLNGRLEPWTEVFKNWKDRALLSPKPSNDWGRAERRLAERFTLLPATLQSLRFWVEELEHGDDARFERWRERVTDAPAAIFQPDDEQPLPMLLLQYPRELVRWVAACAIYPSLHWDLTLWMGRRVGKIPMREGVAPGSAPPSPPIRGGESIAPGIVNGPFDAPDTAPKSSAFSPPHGGGDGGHTLDTLLKIFRIRWFVAGHIPQTARTALLQWLEKEDPALIPRLRGELAALLAQKTPPKDSAVWADHRMAIVMNQWLSETNPKKKKELEAEIARLLPRTEADFTVLKYLDRPPSPLHFPVPEAWKKFVYRSGFRALGFSGSLWSLLGAGLLWLLGVLGLFSWQPAQPDDCPGHKVTYVFKSDAKSPESVKPLESTTPAALLTLCLNTPTDSLLWLERLALDTLDARLLPAFDSLAAQAIRLRVPPDTLAHARDNFAATLYNTGVDYARRGQKDSACLWFQKAAAWDVEGRDHRAENSWCNSDTAALPPPASAGACRIVAQTDIELDGKKGLHLQSYIAPQGRATHIVALCPLGSQVALLDSTATHWKLRYNGIVGYADKWSEGKPTLLPCGAKPPKVIASPDTTTTPAAFALPPMVFIQGGTFRMGSDDSDAGSDEKPAHEVTLRDFEMGKTEVTVAQYMAFANETKSHYPEWLEVGSEYNINTGTNDLYKKFGAALQEPNHPIVGISWNDATAYCDWLSKKVPGRKYRLPTEAEWEYAAGNGAKHTKYSWGNGPPSGKKGGNVADETAKKQNPSWNIFEGYTDGFVYTAPVGSFAPNDFGLFDMTGNVWEWCRDWYANYKDTGKPTFDPPGPVTGSNRVLRGGSWLGNAGRCRVSIRNYNTPGNRNNHVGFRLLSSPQ